MLTKGWTDLHKFNDFPDNVEVVLGYYGYNLFFVQMFKEVDNVCCIPKWHSRSKIPYETMHFDTHVWEINFQIPMKVFYLLFISFKYLQILLFYNIRLYFLYICSHWQKILEIS